MRSDSRPAMPAVELALATLEKVPAFGSLLHEQAKMKCLALKQV